MRRRDKYAPAVGVALILAACLTGLALKGLERRSGQEEYRQAAELAGLPARPVQLSPVPSEANAPESPPATGPPDSQSRNPVPAGSAADEMPDRVDLAALRAVNPEVLGWLLIPGTTVSYPLLQGQDNRYYLDHTWTGRPSSLGAIFLDCRNALTDDNLIVYGHRAWGDAMFGPLRQYGSPDFRREHPWIFLITDGGLSRYEIFAAYEAEVSSEVYCTRLEEAEERLLTLSTCTAVGSRTTRWVVQAVLREAAEDTTEQKE